MAEPCTSARRFESAGIGRFDAACQLEQASVCCTTRVRPDLAGRVQRHSIARLLSPVAKIISVIIITVTGLTLAFGDTSGGFRRLIQIVFGLSIAFAASSFFLSFFSFSGGALV